MQLNSFLLARAAAVTLPVTMAIQHAAGRARGQQAHGLSVPVIVSLTSHPPRFGTLIHTLRSLLLQRTRPDRLELCLAEPEASALPSAVLNLRNDGLTLRIADDLGPYKKYIPVRTDNPEAIIVTADDDAWYWPTWLGELLREWRPDRRVVLAHRANRISVVDGKPRPYVEWQRTIADEGEHRSIFPTGLGGVLYAPGVHHDGVLDRDRFQQLCPQTDDVWLYWMGLLAGATFRKVGPIRKMVYWRDSQGAALWKRNVNGGRNDLAIAAMIDAYGLPSDLAKST